MEKSQATMAVQLSVDVASWLKASRSTLVNSNNLATHHVAGRGMTGRWETKPKHESSLFNSSLFFEGKPETGAQLDFWYQNYPDVFTRNWANKSPNWSFLLPKATLQDAQVGPEVQKIGVWGSQCLTYGTLGEDFAHFFLRRWWLVVTMPKKNYNVASWFQTWLNNTQHGIASILSAHLFLKTSMV